MAGQQPQIDFFKNLPVQSLQGRLARLALASWKFPQSALMALRSPQGDQYLVPVIENHCHHDMNRRERIRAVDARRFRFDIRH